jgi:pyruvate carboxylase subunit B
MIDGTAPLRSPADFPAEFIVDVDGEVFNVKISPAWGQTEETTEKETFKKPKEPKDLPPGAIVCGMAGLVLSIEVKVGDRVKGGDRVATLEAMKMRRHLHSAHDGVVKEIFVHVGEMIDPEDILMVVE